MAQVAVLGVPQSGSAWATADPSDQRSVRAPFRIGTWHEADGDPLEAALAHLADKCSHLMPLARMLLPRLPRALLCSNNLKTEKASSRYRIMNRAMRRKWMGMQAREQKRINVLMIDCDKDGWRERLETLICRGLPRPTMIVCSSVHITGNPRTGLLTQDRPHETAHLYWVLKFPVRKDSPKAYDLFTRTREGLIALLDGDTAAAGHLGKNPFHPSYVTEVGPLEPVELLDLIRPMQEWCDEGEYFLTPRTVSRDGGPRYMPAVLPLASPSIVLTNDGAAQWGKLFEARHGVYAARARDYGTILALVEEHAAAVGSRASRGDIKDTARSIHRFMTCTYAGAARRPDIDHGVMTREAMERDQRGAWVALDKRSKRVLAAERTATLRKDKTDAAIAAIVARLWAEEQPITQGALAVAAAVGIRRIKQLWNDIVTAPKGDLRSYQGFTPQGSAPAATVGLAPAGDGGGTPLLTLKQLSILSKERARAALARAAEEARAAKAEAERIAGLVRMYEALVEAMQRRGAAPQPVPPCTPGSPLVVREAHDLAVATRRDAMRRATARRDRAAQESQAEERRQDFARWAAAGDAASWQAFLAHEEARWDTLAIIVAGQDRYARERHHVRHALAFRRYRKEWKEAVNVAGLTDEGIAARAAVRALPRLPRRVRCKGMRTTLDGLDRIAAGLPMPEQEVPAARVRERAEAQAVPHPPSPPMPSFLRDLIRARQEAA